MSLRENWRLVALVILVTLSGVVLFAPSQAVAGPGGGESLTNLQYGLELSGGTRIRAPLVGMTAEGVDVTVDNQADLETAVAAELEGVSRANVQARPTRDTVEVFAEVDREAFVAALEAAGASPSEVRVGVTEPTRQTAVEVIRQKIDESGLAGGTVQQVTTSTGEHFVVIEVPNRNRSEVERLVASRGVVEIVAHFPNESGDGFREEVVLTQEQVATVGTAQAASGQVGGVNAPHVPVVLSDSGAEAFADDMRTYGFTGPGVNACPPDAPPNGNNTGGYCLYTVLDGDTVYSASMGDGLAADIESGDFVESRNFVMTTTNMSDARQLQINLRAGALPAPLDLEGRGTSYFLAPSLAEDFKLFSLIVGIVAVLAVAGVVFLRYGDPRVAAPMVVTALSEVVILLGFAAGVGLALDLSHIAGFIAVIGTGVDDLIIIADEVMAEGSVSSDRVFQSRFRKAFWVIGAAAITTVIAMSPLAILSLGDLRGFAIVTILGVFVGVLITRPAYGDILRSLLTRGE
ncbi:MAG: preprotein translocase subunit SecD [Actinobacteria bacterium]|nr:preprotein translocase subunit SecD [Actinomycetota bacterium]NIU71782.1 preprotein translocase subunit SecD [Actinomycetota bacterium]NIW33731.1 preprotein translocase subunit SecD [Actinomycetota bacterium]NIX25818.1 preprotein translocase subunit SecD [Actinomycetota bacterium]